ncbi:hypothetical protein RvY_18437 [Ramazzottius varieornatus]|uniref:Uncharacterized protein n=1 Tax=Ramazzottius varieornatus TaxID=947166 RepID=A0A1D1WAF6_RAMVA|nr:hypothetical protein RvY_18437 [Ramazzottius varieornatus]
MKIPLPRESRVLGMEEDDGVAQLEKLLRRSRTPHARAEILDVSYGVPLQRHSRSSALEKEVPITKCRTECFNRLQRWCQLFAPSTAYLQPCLVQLIHHTLVAP